jgi:rhamnogalacturonyl hydrolase YesR
MNKQMYYLLVVGFLSFISSLFFPVKVLSEELLEMKKLPKEFQEVIHSIKFDRLGSIKPQQEIKNIDRGLIHVRLIFDLSAEIKQDDWQLTIQPAFIPDFNWAPHITPGEKNIIDQHVFRSPAMIVTDNKQGLAVIPDINIMKNGTPTRWYMDMIASENKLIIGMSETLVSGHVIYERKEGAVYPKGKVEFGFYMMKYTDKEDMENPFRRPLKFFWTNWGKKLYEEGNPIKGDLEPYVDYTYNWAFNTWKDAVWQEFMLGDKKVGAPVFIVNTTQSPNYPGRINEREFRSIWNQAWFSSLRSASGLYRYARRKGDKELLNKALLSKELALATPMKEGFFYGLIGTEMETVETEGKQYNRSKGWDTYYWGNSNRNPYTWDARKSPFHILDMSWTATLMLRWYEELEKDERLLEYTRKYADALLKKQDAKGFFPGWLDLETLEPMEYLNDSPETSMSVTFLLKLYELTKIEKYRSSALRAIDAVCKEIVPVGRWEDFETYWSCCRLGTPEWVGKKVERNNMYKQCNFSIFWTAEALLESYRITKNKEYLKLGQRTLDEMLMTQTVWQPPYIYVNVVGGFGVMNADGEWNDSRQSLFAETILQYGNLLNKKEYNERGLSAIRASFSMMYCPENPLAKEQWERVWPFFNEKDYGFTMENYGHDGRTSKDGIGIGEFTIYDWGNGAAAEAYNRIRDKFGVEIFR